MHLIAMVDADTVEAIAAQLRRLDDEVESGAPAPSLGHGYCVAYLRDQKGDEPFVQRMHAVVGPEGADSPVALFASGEHADLFAVGVVPDDLPAGLEVVDSDVLGSSWISLSTGPRPEGA